MTENYKLCPKCNNALDLNVVSCPYCWESVWIVLGWNQIKQSNKRQNPQTKKAVKLYKLIIILFLLPVISSVISFIIGLISGIFNL